MHNFNALQQPPPSRAGSLSLVGGDVALDFANTCSGRGGDACIEHLRLPAHLSAWARHAGIAKVAEGAGAAQSDEGALESAISLRETIYGIGAALAAGKSPAPDALAAFSGHYGALVSRGRMERRGEHYRWHWPEKDVEGSVLGPVAIAFADLLSHGKLHRIKRCPGQDCGWLFYDTSRNGRRRWCEMQVCGNRNKMQRFRSRRQGRSVEKAAN